MQAGTKGIRFPSFLSLRFDTLFWRVTGKGAFTTAGMTEESHRPRAHGDEPTGPRASVREAQANEGEKNPMGEPELRVQGSEGSDPHRLQPVVMEEKKKARMLLKVLATAMRNALRSDSGLRNRQFG